jgi:hypothetical protein
LYANHLYLGELPHFAHPRSSHFVQWDTAERRRPKLSRCRPAFMSIQTIGGVSLWKKDANSLESHTYSTHPLHSVVDARSRGLDRAVHSRKLFLSEVSCAEFARLRRR